MEFAEIRSYDNHRIERVCHLMEETLSSDIALLRQTNEFVLAGGGKHIRPLLALLVAGGYGKGINADVEKYAAAAELLHNATLMHDDVVDDAAWRRSRPTVMSVLNPRASVLIGDFWLTRAIGLILSAETASREVIGIFSKTLSDLAEGEILQMEKSARCDTTLADYLRIIYCKTASLFEASALAAACAVGADAAFREAVRQYAVHLGLAFQLKDDIMDYTGGDIGKPIGQDLMERKVTIPLLCALETVPPAGQEDIRARLSRVQAPEEAAAVAAFVREHDGVSRAQSVLEDYVQKACDSIACLRPSLEKEYLTELARFSIRRNQ